MLQYYPLIKLILDTETLSKDVTLHKPYSEVENGLRSGLAVALKAYRQEKKLEGIEIPAYTISLGRPKRDVVRIQLLESKPLQVTLLEVK